MSNDNPSKKFQGAEELTMSKRQLLSQFSAQNIKDIVSELQRSIEFCRTQLGIAAPDKLILDPIFSEQPKILAALQQQMPMPVDMLDVQKILQGKENLDLEYQMDCFALWGGILGLNEKPAGDGDESAH
ncbi:MAG: hypothetical protein AABY34_05995 [Pseudomonadota bacterium]